MPGKAMYRHILIATDGSRSAGKAVATGLALAAALKAEVTAITAEEPFEALLVAEPSQRLPMAEFEHAAAESARRILAEISERAREQGIDCATMQVSDFPAPAILATAKARGVRLDRHVVARPPWPRPAVPGEPGPAHSGPEPDPDPDLQIGHWHLASGSAVRERSSRSVGTGDISVASPSRSDIAHFGRPGLRCINVRPATEA
jgi:nucleotide-binding universal stress UspA family protein